MNNVLTLTNRIGRIVYRAIRTDNYIKITYERGGGIAYKLADIYMGAMCIWIDNLSCKVSGSESDDFIAYCRKDSLMDKTFTKRTEHMKLVNLADDIYNALYRSGRGPDHYAVKTAEIMRWLESGDHSCMDVDTLVDQFINR